MEIEKARSFAGLPCDPTLLQPLVYDLAEPLVAVPPPQIASAATCEIPLTFGDAYSNYIDDPTRAWTANTREAYLTSRKLAVAVIGDSVPIASISRSQCRDFLDVLAPGENGSRKRKTK